MNTATEALEVLTSIIPRLGSDDEISSITADLTSLSDYLQTVEAKEQANQDEIERLGIRNRELQSSNNMLFRQVSMREEQSKPQSEPSTTERINALFD